MPDFETPDGAVYVCPACFDGFHDVCMGAAETHRLPCECGRNRHEYEPWLDDEPTAPKGSTDAGLEQL